MHKRRFKQSKPILHGLLFYGTIIALGLEDLSKIYLYIFYVIINKSSFSKYFWISFNIYSLVYGYQVPA